MLNIVNKTRIPKLKDGTVVRLRMSQATLKQLILAGGEVVLEFQMFAEDTDRPKLSNPPHELSDIAIEYIEDVGNDGPEVIDTGGFPVHDLMRI